MSRATMYPISKDGSVDLAGGIEYGNSWLGAMMIWSEIGKKHGREVGFRSGAMEAIWALAGDNAVPQHERIVMAMTFDKVYVAAENFRKLIDAIWKCRGVLPANCHAFAWADKLEDWTDNPHIRGACWQATSVSENQWQLHNPDTDEYRPVNIDVDNVSELFENTPVAKA